MPSLYKALIPISKAYVNAAGYRKVGLKYDDLIIEERRDVEKVRDSDSRSAELGIGTGIRARRSERHRGWERTPMECSATGLGYGQDACYANELRSLRKGLRCWPRSAVLGRLAPRFVQSRRAHPQSFAQPNAIPRSTQLTVSPTS